MQGRFNYSRSAMPHPSGMHLAMRGARACVCVAVLGSATVPCDFSQVPQAPTNSAQPKQSIINPAANRIPDKNEQMKLQEQQLRRANFEAANAERKRQLDDDSVKLLKLATELKGDVDKTNKETLSVNVVRKAAEIERLAHDLQVKMKLTMSAAN